MQDRGRLKYYDRPQKAIHDKPAIPNDVTMLYNFLRCLKWQLDRGP